MAKQKQEPKQEPVKLSKPAKQVLGALAKHTGKGLTRKQVAEQVEKTDKLINGRIATESTTYAWLEKQGFVTAAEADGKAVYKATAKGKTALNASK